MKTRDDKKNFTMFENPNVVRIVYGMVKHVKKTRNCLKCGRVFESEWNGNRICDLCKFKTSSVNRQIWQNVDDYMPSELWELKL